MKRTGTKTRRCSCACSCRLETRTQTAGEMDGGDFHVREGGEKLKGRGRDEG